MIAPTLEILSKQLNIINLYYQDYCESLILLFSGGLAFVGSCFVGVLLVFCWGFVGW